MDCTKATKQWVLGNDYFAEARVARGLDVFVPGPNQYPHVHLGSHFIVYSKTPNIHNFLVRGDAVHENRIDTAYTDNREPHIMQLCRYLKSQWTD